MASSPEPMDGSLLSEEPSELAPLPTDNDKAARKARRQTAIYPNTLRSTPKPFSRSAAKRESVMALGSIEHLQHYFTKTGIAARQKPMGRTKGLVPAIGGPRHIRAASSVTSIPELPPSPMYPTTTASRPPFVHLPKTYEVDPDHLRPGVIRDLKAVEQAWRLSSTPPQDDKLTPQPSPSSSFDVLSTLRITTRAIRSVRDYVVSLPDDHPTHTAKVPTSYRSPAFSAPSPSRPPAVQSNPSQQSLASVMHQTLPSTSSPSLRPVQTLSPRPSLSQLPSGGGSQTLSPRPSLSHLSPSPRPSLLPSLSAQNTGASNASTTSGGGQSSQPFPSRPEEPLALVRRAALDVLIALRGLEERARIATAEPDPNATVSAAQGSNDTRSASSRSDTPADRVGSPGMFHSGDDEESATSLSTFSPAAAARSGLPRLQIATGITTETVLVHGRGAVQVWSDSDEEDGMMNADEPEKREVWDEKLVLGGGWLYRPDMAHDDVLDEVGAVKRYLDVVDAVLFNGPARGGKRGWERDKRKGRKSENPLAAAASVMSDSEDEPSGMRRVSEAMRYLSTVEDSIVVEEDEEEDGAGGEGEEVPDWAGAEPFGSDLIARTNALLRYFLPPTLVSLLPTSPTRDTLLSCLSDGQMLCVAYNSAVRKSKKAWGFINTQSIHDTAAATSEEKTAGSFTFRRKENLGLWAAALKLRYVIDIVPAGPKTSNTTTRHFHQAPAPEAESVGANEFSPIVIAKHEHGWEDMLERAIWEWVNAVVTETKDAAASLA
ncbi:hypothetical protein FRC07_007025 [Ceratobasidium sp. 392]|nr:hypothetical protein FRC07_007025 [Ceratobasidium sp. 392]